METGVFKLKVDCGRNGYLTGLFVAPKQYVKVLIDEKIEVYFGEVLGKHSEVFGRIREDEIELVSDKKEVIDVVKEHNLENGFNPFDYQVIHFDYDRIGVTDKDVYLSVEDAVEMLINKNA